jgi:serine/threonine-protein kinase
MSQPPPDVVEEAGAEQLPEGIPDRVFDPHQVVHKVEAWMPETIAVYKLRGFVQDVGGEVIESVPGRVRVRLGGPGSVYVPKGKGAFSWLGIGRRPGQIEVDLYLDRLDATRESMLQITVAMRPGRGDSIADASWRARCDQIFIDLRGYLMGKSGSTEPVHQ